MTDDDRADPSLPDFRPVRRGLGPLKSQFRAAVIAFLVAISFSLSACSGPEPLETGGFVGKWKSSRATTPIYIYENGEWEIKTDEGAVLQYGVWEIKGRNFIWSYKIGANIGHDLNLVLSAAPREFKLKEADGSSTTFSKLD